MDQRQKYYDDMTRRDCVQADLDAAILEGTDIAKISKLRAQLEEWNTKLAIDPGRP